MTNTEKLAYSVYEACEATSLKRSTIYAYISAGRLRVVRIGGRTIIPADSLRTFLEGGIDHG